MKVALVSDTHGLIRPELLDRILGVDAIVHAGDVGPADLIAELEAVAPILGVWGNTDGFDVRARLPDVARAEWEGQTVVVLHGHQLGMPTPDALAARHPGADLIVYGHTHVPSIQRASGILTVNPGSAGPVRGKLRPTIALATIDESGIRVELVEIA